ncbi:MAG: lysophospholipid acyltransferase family protein [Candidatus Poribacteria bacterium]|nr:lysophospholipid acyltransferase family protein [Candidatus Poribacteria bacterium]
MKDYCYGLTTKCVGHCVLRLPRRIALFIGASLATVVFLCSRQQRNRAYTHLEQSLRLDDPFAVQQLVRRCFQNLGKNLMEFLQFPRMSPEQLHQFVTFEGSAHIDRALAQGNGAIILTGHLGNWELLAASIVANGYPLSAIARQLRSKRLDKILRLYREKAGYSSIDRDASVRRALRCLKRNELLGILADVDTRTEGVFVDFFGRPAYTPYGPVAIALKTGAVILPTFIIRQPDDSHRAVVEAPLPLQQSGNWQQDLIVNTQRFTKVIESHIRRYPEQWIWMHERWKTQPQETVRSR